MFCTLYLLLFNSRGDGLFWHEIEHIKQITSYHLSISMYGCEPGRLVKRRERDWTLSKCSATEQWWLSNGCIELQMKFLKELEKEELCGRVWGRGDVKWWGTHWDTLRDILEECGKEKVQIRRCLPNIWGYGMWVI